MASLVYSKLDNFAVIVPIVVWTSSIETQLYEMILK